MWKRSARQAHRNFVVIEGDSIRLSEQHICTSAFDVRVIANRLLARAAENCSGSGDQLRCLILDEENRFIEAVDLALQIRHSSHKQAQPAEAFQMQKLPPACLQAA